MSQPFGTVRLDESEGNLSVASSFEYEGRNVWLRGEIEKVPDTDGIKLRGFYRTSEDLEAGTQLAIQVYDESGHLRVRDLPRIPFTSENNGYYSAELDEVYRSSDWAIGFDTDTVVIQFNYIKEGEYWYDIKYPSIELPSLRVENVNSIERFDVRWSLIPRILPRGTGNYLPVVFLARKAHDGKYLHRCSVEAFWGDEELRREQERRPVETSWSVGEGRRLAIGYLRLPDSGIHLVRHGFVWDGVQWFENARTDNLKRVWVVPAFFYVLGLLAAFVILYLFWNRAGRCASAWARLAVKGAILYSAVVLLAWASSNSYALLVGVFALGLWVTTRSCSRSVRLYLIGFLMLAVLEAGWSYLYANSNIRLSGFLLSLVAYSLIILPIVFLKSITWGAIYLAIVSVLSFSNYMLLDIYYSFFKDYPSLRVIEYAPQSMELLDSIGTLLKDGHAVSLLILGWFWFCTTLVLRDSKRGLRRV